MSVIASIYNNPRTGLVSAQELYRRAKEADSTVTMRQVKEFLASQYTAQVHRQIGEPKHYFPITASNPGDLMQLDIIDVSNLATMNRNFKYILVGVDVYTRMAYCVPIKNKITASIINAFTKIINKAKPLKIVCDNGSEFTSRSFVSLCQDKNIAIDYVNINNHHDSTCGQSSWHCG